MTENEDEISFPPSVTTKVWVKRGSLMVRAEALDADDPDHPYNQLLDKGFRPEDFGYKNPLSYMYENLSREELIEKILLLKREIGNLYRESSSW